MLQRADHIASQRPVDRGGPHLVVEGLAKRASVALELSTASILPASGAAKPAIMRRSVVLPQPTTRTLSSRPNLMPLSSLSIRRQCRSSFSRRKRSTSGCERHGMRQGLSLGRSRMMRSWSRRANPTDRASLPRPANLPSLHFFKAI